MILADKLIDAVHEGKLDLHCVAVTIKQKCIDGISISGYGALKINKVGTIYLEFICMKVDNFPKSMPRGFQRYFPDDRLDPSQSLYLETVSLDGNKLYAEGFSLQLSVFKSHPPFDAYAFLHEIYLTEDRYPSKELQKYLYFELHGKSCTPANKSNSETDTYGRESHSRNESEIKFENTTVNIIAKNDRVVVKALGDFIPDDLYQSLIFYIGLTAGFMPQPYSIIKGVGDKTTIYLRSLRKELQGKTIAAPVTDSTSGKGFPDCHYAILSSMVRIKRTHRLRFESAFSQWQRVWHAFQSENDITKLSLGVAVEGLLNDVFIPALNREPSDPKLEQTKSSLIEELTKIKADDEHKETLISTVERWGNIHPMKALSILVEKGLVLKAERKSWRDLRNSSAHPVFKEISEASQLKEQDRLATTLTLFYRLILNIFEYEGPMFEFRPNSKPDFKIRPFIKVL